MKLLLAQAQDNGEGFKGSHEFGFQLLDLCFGHLKTRVFLFNEFYELREELQTLISDPNITQEQADDIRERLLEKETELHMNPIAAQLIRCESQFNNYVNSVLKRFSTWKAF